MNNNPFLPGPKRPKMDFPQGLLPGGPRSTMNLPLLQMDDSRLSDDEDSLKHKGNLGSKLSAEAKRSQHCEVEKRRREKMNRYMSELAQMIPACNAVPRKLDKLSILKMAVDHMKNLRGDPFSSSDYKPGFLTDEELKQLVVEAANGFMIIISCDKAKILFVTDTISDVLNESVENWLGTTLYDLLHPKDIQKVKEQLTSFDVEEALAANSKQNVGKSPLVMHPQSMNGLRRSFLCRIRRGGTSQVSPDSTSHQLNADDGPTGRDAHYAVLHCTGFIRNLTPAERQSLQVDKDITGSCLVAVARLQHFGDTTPQTTMTANEKEFISRVGTDGRFTYVDPRVTSILGYLPQDLIGQNTYDYFHPDDAQKMVQLHHEAMKQRGPMPTVHYRFLSKHQKWVWLAMKAFGFVNPFSHHIEYVVCTNIVHTRSAEDQQDSCTPPKPHLSSSRPSTSPAAATNTTPDVPSELSGMLPDLGSNDLSSWNSLMGGIYPPNSGPPPSNISSTAPTSSRSNVVVMQPADTTVQENALATQKIVDNYLKLTMPPPHRKDFNYSFPPGLFSSEVDLEGSAQAYHNLIDGLDNNSDLQQLLNQVDADPFKSTSIFNELDLDIFD